VNFRGVCGKVQVMFLGTRSPEPIEGLFVAHFGSIYRFAACRVGRDPALDIAAETFAQALRSFDRLDPKRDARAWLFGIASNVIRHHRRAEERRMRAYAAAERQSDAPGTNGRPVESENLLQARLVEGLMRLDARDRETLLLFAWADLSYEEIATALEIPLGTVRSRIHRARRALRKVLADGVLSGGLAVVGEEEARTWMS
jgi:RNA polymerase sigma factor (sigma-70 family)